MGVMSSFGSTKFTYYRNQIRSKLMGNKEVDVEGLSIKSLHNYLWKCFLPASTSLANPKREHLTLMLRSFCSTHKMFRKGGAQRFAFWTEFRDFFNVVMDDQRDDKWDKLMEKEEKRIKNMLINYILSGGGGLKLKGIYLHMFKSFNRAGCCAHF